MGLVTLIVCGAVWIGVGTGVVILVLFGIYLAIAGYIAERPVCELRCSTFGFVFQFYHLLPELSVLENALMAPMVARSWFGYRQHKAQLRARAKKVLEDLGLGDRLKHKHNQL